MNLAVELLLISFGTIIGIVVVSIVISKVIEKMGA
jgi:hypothetical protein